MAGASAESLQDNTAGGRAAGQRGADQDDAGARPARSCTVPRYAAPEVLPNGDIIIRRLDPQENEEEPIETNGDGIET